MRSLVTFVVGSIGALSFAPHRAAGQLLNVRPEIAAAVASLNVSTTAGRRVGSCVLIRDDGLAVTSFELLRSANAATATFADGSNVEVKGVVAACRGKNLAIIALKKAASLPRPATLSSTSPKLDDSLALYGGPAGAPFTFAAEKLTRIYDGEDFAYGLEATVAKDSPPDLDCWRLRANTYLSEASSGGAMVDAAGQLVGVLTLVPEWTNRVHTAVRASHVLELLPTGEQFAVKPLSSLRKWEDSASPPPTPASIGESSRAHQRGLPGDDRIAEIVARLLAIENERLVVAARAEEWKTALRKPQQERLVQEQTVAALNAQLAAMQPEVARRRRVIRTIENAETGAQRQERGEAIDRSFSPSQLAERRRIQQEIQAIQQQAASTTFDLTRAETLLQQTAIDRTLLDRRESRWRDAVLHLVDPLGTRPPVDAQRTLAALDEAIAEGGMPAVWYVARATVKARLGNLAEAHADLDEALDVDGGAGQLVDVARAGLLLQKNKDDAQGKRLLDRATREAGSDHKALLLRAKAEGLRGNWQAAVRALESSLENGGDRVELHRTLGLILASEPSLKKQAKEAMPHARLACELTGWRDWQSILALAAAHASQNEWEVAAKLAEKASRLAGDEFHARCERCRAAYAGGTAVAWNALD